MKIKNRVFLTLTVAICTFGISNSFAQDKLILTEKMTETKQVKTFTGAPPVETGDSVYTEVDVMPEIIGGFKSIIDNLVYPKSAKEAGKQGTVFVEAVVGKSGDVVVVNVKKGVDKELDYAAVNAIKKIKFTPGKIKGKAVNVQLIIPIKFALDNQSSKRDNLHLHGDAGGTDKKETIPFSEPEEGVLLNADVMPEPIGGIANILKDLVYPEEATKNKIEGKVLVSFIVDEKGNVTKPTVIRGIGYGCDEAAVKALSTARFTPGKENGKTVKVKLVLPIMFKLN